MAIPPIYVYINRIHNRLVFRQMPDTMKLFGSTKKLTH